MQDVRHAGRVLRRSPAFTLVAVVTLALGIGANTAIFSAVNGILFAPLPFPESEQLVTVHRAGATEADMSALDAADIRASSRTVSGLGIYMPFWSLDLNAGGEPERLTGALADPAFLSTLAVTPLAGRTFTTADGDARVLLISEALWRRRFRADPGVVGTVVTVSDNPATIIGVMPAALDYEQLGLEFWVPVAAEASWAYQSFSRGSNNFRAVARVADGMSIEQASAEIQAITTSLAEQYPSTNGRKILAATSLRAALTAEVRPALLALLGAVALVLLIACANLSNLLLARAAARQPELAVRVAIGAGRARLTRQVLAESLGLALLGGGAGLLLAQWGTDLLVAAAPTALPRAGNIGMDLRVLAFTGGLTLLTGLLFGVLPARWASRRDPAEALAGAGRGAIGGPRRLLDGLIVAEVALAFLLLVGAGLLLRTFDNLRRVDLGFRSDSLLVSSIVLPESRYGTIDAQTTAFSGIVAALETVPGISHATIVIGAPLESGGIGHSLRFDGRPPAPEGQAPGARLRPVTGDYFATLELPLVRGRPLTRADRNDAPLVAVVNESFAAAFYPDEDPLGKRFAWTGTGDDAPRWMTIVGIARDVAMGTTLSAGDEVAAYTPYAQRTEPWQRFGTVVARTRVPPASLERQVREAVWSVDPTLTLAGIGSMAERRRGAMAQQRFNAVVLSVFATVALLMAMQGISGVLAYAVEQRRREIGIRMALGARRRLVVGMVLRHGLLRVGIGLAVGAGLTVALVRVLRSLLFGVAPTDAIAFGAAAVLLFAVASLACWMPASRASRTDPLTALRSD